MTAGLRIDMPFYPIDAPRNTAVDALNLSIPNPNGGDAITPDVSSFPGVNPLISPRVGFNWDVFGDRNTQVRGGTGVFSGRLPFGVGFQPDQRQRCDARPAGAVRGRLGRRR